VRLGARVREWRDVAVASDPGLNRLFWAIELTVAVAVTVAVVYGFVQLTHVMWVAVPIGQRLQPAQLAALDAQHHGTTLLMMLLGGILGLLAVFMVQEPTKRGNAVTIALMPLPLLATLALGISLVHHHWIGIAALAIVMGFSTYMRRWVPRFGPRLMLYGVELFVGLLFGFLSRGAIGEHELGWIALVSWLAAALSFVLKLAVARPLERGRLGRTSRAFRIRTRKAIEAASTLFDAADDRGRERAMRRLSCSLRRMNETALLIDASLADDSIRPLGSAAFEVHNDLFELELVIHNVCRLAETLAGSNLPPRLRAEVSGWLTDLRVGGVSRAAHAASGYEHGEHRNAVPGLTRDDAALVHRLATLIVDAAAARQRLWSHRREAEQTVDGMHFESPVTLILGDLPGSALVSAKTAASGSHVRNPLLRRLRLDPAAQAAIRMALAVGAAGAIGTVISERRFYWAVIAVFITFMGTNTSGEQVTKALNRIVGTVLGILLGSLLAHAVGISTWSVVVIIGALSLGIYFMKISYGLMVIGVTVAVSQLYEQLGEYSNHLLVLRLEETAVGASIAAICALAIFPLATRRVATVAAVDYLESLSELLERVRGRLQGTGGNAKLTPSIRALDFALQQYTATIRPLRLTPMRRGRLEYNTALVVETAHRARNLSADVERHDDFAPLLVDELASALNAERSAVSTLTHSLQEGGGAVPLRRLGDTGFAALSQSLDAAGLPADSHQQRMLRDLDRLDEALAELQENLAGASAD
jgi:uncharacterized membrane protein YgaE (UPF0421/DUF939 family)